MLTLKEHEIEMLLWLYDYITNNSVIVGEHELTRFGFREETYDNLFTYRLIFKAGNGYIGLTNTALKLCRTINETARRLWHEAK